jgi:hypothetical protein
VAEHRDGFIRFSYFAGSIKGDSYAGGLAGSVRARDKDAFPLIATNRFEGQVAGGTVGGIAAKAERGAFLSGNASTLTVPSASVAGGIVGNLSCSATLEKSFAQGEMDEVGVAGALVGVLGNANISRGYGTVALTPGYPARGGSVGKMADDLLIIVNGQSTYACTGSSQRPIPSKVSELYYDSFKSPAPGAAGLGRSTAQLRVRSTFPSDWFEQAGGFKFTDGFMPWISGLPRAASPLFPGYP